ncbi:GerAB/ArcD/ProY family transporter [Lysinibacillus antri]|uniref:Spore gernimation protein n=1 Tax=Lysinibacillus antri TaxID=2498145 RepID=A0A432L828_9BACI|nr:GerAB/ArcD/ProY family transporter [Lysinibacillus antri]RUL48624.1 spore gernimation protein [Lysinibacillus antri]
MNVNMEMKKQNTINAFLVLFVVHTAQMGIGVAGIQRVLYKEVQQDAWIVIILSGVITCLIVWIIGKTLSEYENHTLFDIHLDIYGKWLGKFVNLLIVLYLFSVFLSICLGYIEIVQAWMFEKMPSWLIGAFLIILTGKGVRSGFRPIVGVCFLAFLSAIWMLFIFFAEPLKFAEWHYLFPMFELTSTELYKGMIKTSYSLLGFELLYFIYPFVKEKEKAVRFAILGVIASIVILVILTVIAIGYFSGEQLERTIWATISMFKIVKLPFIERFEYIAIPVWMIIIIPNLLLYMWAASKGIKISFGYRQSYALYVFLLLSLVVFIFFNKRLHINMFIDYVGMIGLYVCYVYPIILYIAVRIKKSLQN